MTCITDVLSDVLAEAERATDAWGDPYSHHEAFAVLLEEVDELKAEVWKRERDPRRVYTEAVQVASVAVRFALAARRGLKR